jgi:hypothetical protein
LFGSREDLSVVTEGKGTLSDAALKQSKTVNI